MTIFYIGSSRNIFKNRFLAVLFSFLSFVCSAQHLLVENHYDISKRVIKERYYVLLKNPKIKDSLYTYYFQSGLKKIEGNYNNNKSIGTWTYYYENGAIKMRGFMHDVDKVGVWEYFYESGSINMKGEIIKGKKQGVWSYYYENGQLRSVGPYKDDLKNGSWKYFYEDGILKGIINYENENGEYMEMYPTGELKAQGFIKDGKSDGYWYYYYEDGTIKAEGNEKQGLKDGEWKFYHPNGTISSSGTYVDGKQEGEWTYYYDNGKVNTQGKVEKGQKNGEWKMYYRTGEFKASTSYVNGSGEYKEFYESGKLKVIGKIENDKNVGEWKYFYETGELEGNCFYIDGRGRYRGYFENGKKKIEGDLDNGNKVGVWTMYRDDGSIAGYYKTYYENETPVLKSDTTVKEVIVPKDTIKETGNVKMFKPKKKSRYFTSRVNEFRGYIVSTNPLYLAAWSFPICVEYYLQERLGYEIGVIGFRKPMFLNHTKMKEDKLSYHGVEAYFRQKFYQKDQDMGMLYFAHEIRLGWYNYVNHYLNPLDNNLDEASINQQRFEYSVLVGNRMISDQRLPGLTFDIYLGIGIGYRTYQNNWKGSIPEYDALFHTVTKSPIAFPVRFGFTFGYKLKPHRK